MFIGRKDYRVAYNTIVNAARQAISLSRGTSAVTVLILCAPDVDALCACRILVSLLNDDCVGYRVLPISGWAELATCAQDHIQDNADLRSVLLLNLGALVDLVEYIPLPEAVSLHVIDSHRPWNLANVFSAGLDAQRVIVWDDGDVAEVLQEERTAFEALQFEPDSDSDEDSDSDDEAIPNIRRRRIDDSDDESEGGGRRSKRRKLDEDGNEIPDEEKRLPRKQKQAHRARITKYYNAGTFYGQSIAMQLYVVATLLERADNNLLWFSIIGLTHQFTANLIDRERYDGYALVLANEVARLNIQHELAQIGTHFVSGPTDRSIRPSEELRFTLFRHWNLYDAMFHSGYVAGKLKLWRERGRKNLQGLLAKMGFSLTQCQQTYSHMDMSLKQSLRIKVDSIAPEYGLFDLAYPSFVRASGYQSVLSASDSVEAVGALLEVGTAVRLDFGREEGFKTWGAYVSGEEDNKENAAPAGGQVHQANGGHAGVARQPLGEKDQVIEDPDAVVVMPEDQWWVRNFWLAWNALGEDCSHARRALHLSMALHRSIIRQGTSMLDKQAIKTLRTFRLAIIKEGPDLAVFAHPSTLSRLAVWLVDAVRDLIDKEKSGKPRKSLPFVVAALDEKRDSFLVVGMNGAAEYGDVRKNRFGMAFQEAAQISGARTRHDKFEAGILEIRRDDLQDFLDKLHLSLGT